MTGKPLYAQVLAAAVLVGFLAVAAWAAEGTVRTDLSAHDLARVQAVTTPTADFSSAEKYEKMSGGAATQARIFDRDAFSQFSANLTFNEQEPFKAGNALFRKLWVAAPSSTQASDGLGPLYNSRSCQSCHLKDGRGHPPENDQDDRISMFLRLSVPARTAAEKKALADHALLAIPDPVYGGQLQDIAVPGLRAEGRMMIDYTDLPVTLGDGTVVSLRNPHYWIADLGYGPTDPDLMISPRVAQPMIGLGLLEAIAPEDILAHADPDDKDGDGISGRPSWVRNKKGELVLGRFGWKASEPSIRAQSASAFNGDIGISTPDIMKPAGDCTAAETACMAAPNGVQKALGNSEAPDPVMELVSFYVQNLAVPVRRNVNDPKVLHGKALFYGIGCVSCHIPKYVTSRNAEGHAQRFQLIWPYTDMLLHDMGEGLADHRPVGDATGREWRTQPLWGIGLTQAVSGHTQLLHDGRARNLTEAILWHGGEAQAARDAFANLEAQDRQALLDFLGSL